MSEMPEIGTRADADKAKGYTMGRLAGGEVPDPAKLLSETLAELVDHVGPYLLAGLGQLVVVFPLTLVAVFLGYLVIGGGMFGVMFGGMLAGAAVGQASEGLGGLVMILTQLLAFAVPIVGFGALIMGMIAVLAPLSASLTRAIAAHQRGEKELDFSASFSTATQDIGRVIIAGLIIGAAVTVGMMMCYLPALLVPLFLGFTTTFVALHRRSGLEAARINLQHVMANPGPHLTFGLLYLVMAMFSGYIPILGPMFVASFHVRAYRTLYGDGEEPVIA
jgi:hypothetical protein